MSESNNPSFEGTDTAHHSEADTPETWDYFDPDEEQDTEAAAATEGTDDEEEAGPEPEAEADGDETAEADEEPEIVFSDGTKVPKSEVEKGYLRQADYTRKSQELANKRQAVDEVASRIEGISNAFIDYLTSLVPEEPPYALALTDPGKYTRQKAQYDAAMAQVQKMIEIGQQPKEVRDGLSEVDRAARLQEENRLLMSAIPEVAKDRKRFFDSVAEVANQIGFSTEELQSVSDHRVFVLAHWARKGMEAEKARAAAKAKAQKAPPVTPNKPGQVATKANRNADAMRRLGRSGSIRDALSVDFD